MIIAKVYDYYLECLQYGASDSEAITEAIEMYSQHGVTKADLIAYIQLWQD